MQLMEEEKKLLIETDTAEEKAIDESLALLPLDEQEKILAGEIVKANSQQELQKQFDLFQMTQTKKNALRIIKLNSLLDKVEDQAIKRFEERPDQVSNDDILKYMQTVSSQIDRSQKVMDSWKDKPMITVSGSKTKVNIGNINIGTSLDADSKDRVVDAVKSLLKQIQNPDLYAEENVIDAEIESPIVENETEDIVYKNDTDSISEAIENTDETKGE